MEDLEVRLSDYWLLGKCVGPIRSCTQRLFFKFFRLSKKVYSVSVLSFGSVNVFIEEIKPETDD